MLHRLFALTLVVLAAGLAGCSSPYDSYPELAVNSANSRIDAKLLTKPEQDKVIEELSEQAKGTAPAPATGSR
jgi:hypothetical protein